MHDIFSAFPVLLERYGDDPDVRRSVSFAAWRRAAGEPLVVHAEPIALQNDVLFIGVADRTWQRNLSELSRELVFRINALAGARIVKFIEFVIDKNVASRVKQRRDDRARFESEALDQINDSLRLAADRIQDDEMRRRFLLAAGSCLARNERMSAA